MLSPRAKKILIRAAEILSDPKRWIKGTYHSPPTPAGGEDRYCSIGAIYQAGMEARELRGEDRFAYNLAQFACGGDRDVLAAEKALEQTVRSRSRYKRIPNFNDARSTTHADVKAAFCETIKREVTDLGEEPPAK